MENSSKKIAVEISRVILGIVFVFSGFVKAVDPWGGAYKIQDYFAAFELTDFNFMAMPLSFIQAAIEFGVGACLLIGVYRRFNSIMALLIMLFMTPLTLYIALTDPVTDCGCFGDALVISNWSTFYKNIVLLIAAVFVFLWFYMMTSLFTWRRYFFASFWIYFFILGVSIYCYTYLPLIDFRPYKIGANIPDQMMIPENAPSDIYNIKLLYSKDGVVKEFTDKNYPRGDSTWTFVDSKSTLIKKGYEPPIHNFSITNSSGYSIADDILVNPSYTFLLIAHKLEKASDKNVDKINDIYDFSNENRYDFYALTSSMDDEKQKWIENTGAEYLFCTADDITLKTIIRSNPGLMLIKEGTIIKKWPNTRLPDEEKLNKLIEETNLGKIPVVHHSSNLLLLTLILLTPLAGLFLYDFSFRRKYDKVTKK